MKIIVCIVLLISFSLAQSVYWEPELPVPGGEITIFYNVIEGSLDNNTNPVYVHVGSNGWEGVDDYPMTLEPSLVKACANSTPIAPPPKIIRCSGNSVKEKIVSFVKYGMSKIPSIAGIDGLVPVAMTAYRKLTVALSELI